MNRLFQTTAILMEEKTSCLMKQVETSSKMGYKNDYFQLSLMFTDYISSQKDFKFNNSYIIKIIIIDISRTVVPSYWTIIFFTIRGHPFMTSTKMTNFLTLLPHHPQKWTIDLLFKNNRIHKHVTNFKTPTPPFLVDVINVWSLISWI